MSTFELLNEKMDKGYFFALARNILEAATIWNEAWKIFIVLVDEKGIKTFEEFDNGFNGKKYVINWLPDFRKILMDAAEINFDYHKLIIKVCREYLKRFDNGTSNEITLGYRKALGDSLFALGEEAKSEKYYMMCLKKEPNWTDGWLSWAECWLKFTEGTKKDYKKAAMILNMPLEQKLELSGKIQIYEKLITIYEKLKDRDKIEKMKELKKDEWKI